MNLIEREFFTASLTAGAILTGFCGTFLSFRIQREASYYRQVALDFEKRKAADVFIGLSHFSTSFLMLLIASITTMVFGLVFPLLRLSGLVDSYITIRFVTAGLLSGLILICGYFFVEMLHYGILSTRLLNDRDEWGSQLKWALGWVIVSGIIFVTVLCVF